MDPTPLPPTALSLVPPVLALALAVATRRVGLALGTASWVGFCLIAGLEGRALPAVPWHGTLDFVRVGILGQASAPSQAQVLVLIALIGAFVSLLEVSGAGRALIERITRGVRGPRQVQLATWLAGVVFFFSDLGSILIIGPMFRAMYDRLAVPRERLAWIVDTTAAPVSVLIPVVAWGVYIVGLFEAAFQGADPAAVEAVLPGRWQPTAGTVDGLGTFVDVLPHQLYSWLSLLFVPLMIAAGRAYGPMARARPAAERDGGGPPGALPSALPGALAMAVLLAVLVAVGGWYAATEGRIGGPSVRTSLAAAYLAACAALAASLRREGHPVDAGSLHAGVGRSAPILMILILAWALGAVCTRLGTGTVLAGALGGTLPPSLLPATVFALGAAMSFATGTSWGTFAILVPIVVPLALALEAPAAIALGAVLSGGVVGDHCSPISDTTVLSSMGAGCEHARHVGTQLPYAATVGAAALVGYAVAGTLGWPWSVLAGAAVVVAAVAASRLVQGQRLRSDSRTSGVA